MRRDGGRKLPRGWWLLLAAAVSPLAGAQGGRNTPASAAAVRKQIEALQQRVTRQATERDKNARALRALEVAIAAGSRKLQGLQADIATQRNRQRTLGDDQTRARAQLAAQRAALGRQVRLSYMTGQQEIFRLLLSQETPSAVGRMLTYYDYFNRARSKRIHAASDEVRTLQALAAESARVERNLTALESSEQQEVDGLGRSRDERRQLLAKLDASIDVDKTEIARLSEEQNRLKKLANEISEMTAGFPVANEQPFGRLKGKLAWPVQGRLVGDYGQPRAGGPMKWNGVMIEAAEGTAVRAVYHGRVAFADWLPGLGLLIIVDHGGGYMSLYGHNETLLKESGEWVEPGEAIAQVGDTGGQPRPSLYFEIRKDGEPVDPHAWIGRRPPAAR